MPDQSIRVTIPRYGTEREAHKFLNDNIVKLQNQIKKEQESFFELNNIYQSKFYKFRIIKTRLNNDADIINRNIIIKISEKHQIQSKEAQDYIKYILTQLLRKEANLYIPKKTMEYANKHQLKVTNIKINSAKTRWGSCSAINSINFSLFLMQLPYELIDYVILHELSHTIHKNHGFLFYDLLNKLCNNKHQLLNQDLKKFSPNIKVKYFQKM